MRRGKKKKGEKEKGPGDIFRHKTERRRTDDKFLVKQYPVVLPSACLPFYTPVLLTFLLNESLRSFLIHSYQHPV
uniref:Uncharacterized protein n=1 Tax=Astatotilapia calliptera TaxID=8154 RepID=A0A3P8QRU9_ASTCA